MHRLLELITNFFMCTLLLSCSHRISQQNFDKIENHMPRSAVVELLGEPAKEQRIKVGTASMATTTWQHDNTKIVIQFFGDHVAAKHFSENGINKVVIN